MKNVPYVDNSYKWAGGGFISTAEDLVRFGNAVLGCYQQSTAASSSQPDNHVAPDSPSGASQKSLLSPSTAAMMLSPVARHCSKKDPELSYGMGWYVREGGERIGHGERVPSYFGHTGGAVGASSVLMVIPGECESRVVCDQQRSITTSGVVVAVIFNLQEVKGIFKLGYNVAHCFFSECH